MNTIRFARVLVAAVLGALAGLSAAQPPPPMSIGILSSGTFDGRESMDRALIDGLREHGYVEGKNLTVVRRYGTSTVRQSAAELAGMKLDAVLTTCTPSTRTMQATSSSIPIVMAAVADPVRQGLIDSYARPGRNVTGIASQDEDLVHKRLEMLVALAPSARSVAVLMNAINPSHTLAWPALEREALRLGLDPVRYEVNHRPFDALIADAVAAGANALFVMPDDPLMVNLRFSIVEQAAKWRLPAIYWAREFVDVGGLASYGASLATSYRGAADYFARIKRGAPPGTLPVSQPTRFEMVVNAATAKSLGLGIPPAIRASAEVLP